MVVVRCKLIELRSRQCGGGGGAEVIVLILGVVVSSCSEMVKNYMSE